MDARLPFQKRNGNPEITLVRTNLLVISVIHNFSRGITNTKNQLLGATVYRVECEEVVSKNIWKGVDANSLRNINIDSEQIERWRGNDLSSLPLSRFCNLNVDISVLIP